MVLDKLLPTSEKGVFYRTEPDRKHGVRLDRQFIIVYKLGGKKYRGVIGWESDKHRESEAIDKIKTFKNNFKTGIGPLSLEEERTLAFTQRKEEEEAKRQQAASDIEKNRTIIDLVKEYRPVIEAKVKAKSYASFKSHLDRIETDLGNVLLADLDLKRLESWQDTMKKIPRVSRVKETEKTTRKPKRSKSAKKKLEKLPPLSPLTVNRHIQTLKAMMTKACDWGWITERHLHQQIRKLKLDKERDRRRLDFLSREEAERLINSADPPIRPIIICALQTGMRKEEILGLKWIQVDLVHRLIHLQQTKSGEPRSLPINDRLLYALKDKNLLRSLEDDHVFLNPEKKARWSDLKTPFNRAVKKAKLAHRGIVFHHLRHTAASWMVMAGVPLLTVARVLGHADVQMVSRYSHLTPDHMDKAVAALDDSAQHGKEHAEQQAS